MAVLAEPHVQIENESIDSIRRPDNDNREYTIITLSNHLEILLISDPLAEKSAASMDVHVGSSAIKLISGNLCDPKDINGIAHFLEHLLFMGTKSYPDEAEYTKFLAENGGRSNAFTSGDHTNYYFDIQSHELPQALSMFSKFFIEPLFLESCIDRELKAVDSEHKKNLQNDVWASYQLIKDCSDSAHPFSNFGTGDMTTLKYRPEELGINVRESLLEFHKKYYSANIMKLVVLGKESIAELTKMAIDMFSEVKNKDIPPPTFPQPFTKTTLMKKLSIKPIKDLRSLQLFFPVKDHRLDYRKNPLAYLSHLIGHEGAGSLLSLLKGKGWAHSLSSGVSGYGSRGFEFFKVGISLTDLGLDHHEEIIVHVMEYVVLLKHNGPSKWIYDECTKLNKIIFKFKEKGSPSSYCSKLAEQLHNYDQRDVLQGPYLMEEFDEALISSCMEYFTVENLFVVLQATNQQQEWKKSKWYGVPYAVQGLDDKLIGLLKTVKPNPELFLPEPNTFIPERFEVGQTKALKPFPHPWIITDNPNIRIWHKRDDTFIVPKGYVTFFIHSPLGYDTVENFMLNRLYTDLLKDALNEYSYSAELGGIHYDLESVTSGLMLSISGYTDKLNVLLAKILEKMVSLSVEESHFTRVKEAFEKRTNNWFKEGPSSHCSYHLSSMTQERLFSNEEKLESLKAITLEDVLEYYPKLLRECFIEGLIHGNFSKDDALLLGATITTHLKSKPFGNAVLLKTYIYPQGSVIYEQTGYNPDNVNSGIEYCLQLGSIACPITRGYALLLAQIIQEPAFSVLRTVEQLGYIVHSGLRKQAEMISIRIIIQSECTPMYLEYRIEEFFKSALVILKEMSTEEYTKHQQSLSKSLLEERKNLERESTFMLAPILSQYYDFEQNSADAARVVSIGLQDLIGFFLERVNPGSDTRVKLSVHVKSAKATDEFPSEDLAEMTRIRDLATVLHNPGELAAFKAVLKLSEIPKPFKPLSKFV